MQDKLLTTREVSYILGISEKDVLDLVENNLLPHFKVAGEFVRFKKQDILRVREAVNKKYNLPHYRYKRGERLREFIYFNDFYLVSAAIIIFLIWLVFKDFHL
jgi:excisionase family DNA binding protein